MKKSLYFLPVLFLALQAYTQPLNVKDKSFAETFVFLYKSAGHYLKEVKGSPIISTMFVEPDTIGYRWQLLPAGGAKSCGEEDKWRVSLYFHKMFGMSITYQLICSRSDTSQAKQPA